MSVSLMLKHLPADRDDLRQGEVPWWLGSLEYCVEMPETEVIRELWQKHLPKAEIRFLTKGGNYQMLALPVGTDKKKRDAFLAELCTMCKRGEDIF